MDFLEVTLWFIRKSEFFYVRSSSEKEQVFINWLSESPGGKARGYISIYCFENEAIFFNWETFLFPIFMFQKV